VSARITAVAVGLALLATGCGSAGPVTGSLRASGGAATAGSTTAAPSTATPTLDPLRLPEPASRSTTTRSAPQPATAATCAVPSGVHAAQVVVVRSSGSDATIRACRRSGSHYLLSLGPYAGHVGLHGVSADKQEGDLRAPAGVFPLLGGFGVRSNPGLDGSWLTVDSHDVWVDDSSSALYNTHQRTPADGRWTSAEPMDQSPVYDYAQVIGYNLARTPGRGSAIFLHLDHQGGTEGCVSVTMSGLIAIMRWERPGADIAIS
jgi:L,D-peptidoglycan transpeptidase YkuD (ErfK/YbiS/YcfS/YnhG family)